MYRDGVAGGEPVLSLGGSEPRPSGMTSNKSVEAAADRIVQLEQELESAGHVAVADTELQRVRAVLHDWVDTVVGAVSSPGVGRVTLIHANARESKIASPDLPYLIAKPVTFDN
jgi:hypothetical protein